MVCNMVVVLVLVLMLVGGWWRFWWVGVFGACRADSLVLAHNKQAEALRGLANWQAGGLQR